MGSGRGKVGRWEFEKVGSGRNGGKLPSDAYNFEREKGLKQGSQEKWGGPRNARYGRRQVWTVVMKPLSQYLHID